LGAFGAFSVIDLFLLNALTIVTEFIGIALALDYLGLPRQWGVAAAALIIVASAATGSFAASSASRCCSWGRACCWCRC
jgi:Mn2+/Fe2+ NRAMP family transporter